MHLRLEFQDNRTGHNDLLLRLEDSEWYCDSYYLAIDHHVLPGQEDSEKIRTVLAILLENWTRTIERLANDTTAYLPYDFSDQCTAWLACHLNGQELLVQRGWADVEGWALSPTASATLERPRGFRADTSIWRFTMQEFLHSVVQSIAAARS